MEYTILSNQIAPFVRHAELRNIEVIPFGGVTYAKDWRLFAVSKGECSLTCRETVFSLKVGDSILVPPLQPYQVDNRVETYLYIINFDMLSHNSDLFAPIPLLRQASPHEAPHQIVFFRDIPELTGPILIHAPQVHTHLQQMCGKVNTGGLYDRINRNALFTLVLTELFERLLHTEAKSSISDMITYINAHYGEHITNQSIGEQFHYHPNYVNRLFVTHTGQSLHQYVMRLRIHIATELLLDTRLSIAEIAERTGWHSPSHFSRGFKQITGFSPNAYRKK